MDAVFCRVYQGAYKEVFDDKYFFRPQVYWKGSIGFKGIYFWGYLPFAQKVFIKFSHLKIKGSIKGLRW